MCNEVLQRLEGVTDFTTRLLRQPLAPDSEACVRAIASTGEDLTGLMRRAVDLHDAERGTLVFNSHPCRLQDVMDTLDQRWKTRAASTGLTLLTAYDGDPDHAAELDEVRLLQVFDALVFRALSETRRGAVEVSLKARPTAEGLLMEGRVRDAGVELTTESLAHIFSPLGQSGDDHPEGLSAGLGMALASRIVSAAGGMIRAEPNPGAGVTVIFEFIAAPASMEGPAEATASSEPSSRAAHVLIVDDNATAIDARLPEGPITMAKLLPTFQTLVATAAELTGYVGYPGSDCLNGGVIRVRDGRRMMERLPSHHALVMVGDHTADLRMIGNVFGLAVEDICA
jgi:hypothetical protein